MKKTAKQIEKAKKMLALGLLSREEYRHIVQDSSQEETEEELSPRLLASVLKKFFEKEELSIGWQVRLRHWLLDFFPDHARLMHHFMELSFRDNVHKLVEDNNSFRQERAQKTLLGYYQPTMINFCFGVWSEFFGVEPPEKLSLAPQQSIKLQYKDRKRDSLSFLNYDMVYLASGNFLMGASPRDHQAQKNEFPRHQVILTEAFYIGTHLVTQDLYYDLIRHNPSNHKGARYPVENVSWMDAIQFCNALSDREQLEHAYIERPSGWEIHPTAGGYRLPTEAEWEYAARAGQETLFSGSDRLDIVGWYLQNSGKRTHAVGLKPPNAWGLYDMSGNVWEWCHDWGLRAYGTPQLDPIGLQGGTGKVLRGGCVGHSAKHARISNRDAAPMKGRSPFAGFRIVRRAVSQ